jgi:hypothetical protein
MVGCTDGTKVEIHADLRPGGSFAQKMQFAGAGEYTFTRRYERSLSRSESFMPRTWYAANRGPAMIHVTIEFLDEGEGTKMVVTQEDFPDPRLGQIVSQGIGESFEKLDELLTMRSKFLLSLGSDNRARKNLSR